MKKFLLPILGVTLLSSGLAIPVSAASSDKYWTFEEMQQLNIEAQAEIKTACADTEDFMCADSYLWRKASSDPAYSALMSYRANYLMISAFNPERETIKLFYDARSIPAWENSDPTLADLYLAQYEAGRYEVGFYVPLDRGEELLYANVLLNKRKANDNSEWLPLYTEVEFDAPGLSAAASMDPRILMFYRTVSGASYSLQFLIGDCLTSPDYQPGMECRAVFDASRVFYLPFTVEESEAEADNPEAEAKTEPGAESESETKTEEESGLTLEPEQSNSETSDSVETTSEASVGTAISSETVSKVSSNTTSATYSASSATSDLAVANVTSDNYSGASSRDSSESLSSANKTENTDLSESDAPLAANNVELPKSGDCEQGTTFPWWFILLILVADIAIMWFFWPKHKKTLKK